MAWHVLVSYFFGGAFLANAIPHVVSGSMGRAHQSPFAKPPGKGLSSSPVNLLWGYSNLILGYLLVCRVGDFSFKNTADVVALGAGAFPLALLLSVEHGRLNGGLPPTRQ